MRPAPFLFLLLLAPALCAEDEKKVVQQVAPDETVSLAKQDLESFRKPSLSDLSKLSLMQVPELASAPVVGPSPAPTTADQLLKDQKKNANWLVDGVMGTKKNPNDPHALLDPKELRTKEGDRAEILKAALAEPNKDGTKSEENDEKLLADDPKAAKMDEQAAEAKLSEVKVGNPLDSYMAAWMNPKDLEVLKPAGSKADGPVSGAPEGAPDLEALVDTHADRPGVPIASDKPADNPFIELLNAPQVSEVQEQLLKAPSPPPPAPEPAPAPLLVPDSKGVVPDFAKPLTDDPALKGMKRF